MSLACRVLLTLAGAELLWRLAHCVSRPYLTSLHIVFADVNIKQSRMVSPHRLQHPSHILLPRLLCYPSFAQTKEGRRGM